MEERWHPQQLTRAQLEERRLAAAKQLEAGASRPQIKALFGVSYTTIQRWVARLEAEGEGALLATVSSGRPAALSVEQRDQLVTLLRQGAVAHHHAQDQWTTPRVRDLIGSTFGVWYHRDHVRKLMHSLGWSYQKPEKRALERDEQAITQWTEVTYLEIKKKPRRRTPQSSSPTNAAPT
ncbi:IS630 family transposase [Deinococcus sp. KNUC1210]|uniref:IS630 family transposase n=1 Tax=Deinococcus sp. KNUC1210 TaxID=2917691 RepID=UPI00351D52FB